MSQRWAVSQPPPNVPASLFFGGPVPAADSPLQVAPPTSKPTRSSGGGWGPPFGTGKRKSLWPAIRALQKLPGPLRCSPRPRSPPCSLLTPGRCRRVPGEEKRTSAWFFGGCYPPVAYCILSSFPFALKVAPPGAVCRLGPFPPSARKGSGPAPLLPGRPPRFLHPSRRTGASGTSCRHPSLFVRHLLSPFAALPSSSPLSFRQPHPVRPTLLPTT